MVSKPCERAPLGCLGLVKAKGPKGLARHRFCCRRCSALTREEQKPRGMRGPRLTPERRREVGRSGGVAGGEIRRAKAVRRVVIRLGALIPADMLRRFDVEERARITVLLTKAWRQGYNRGYRCGRFHELLELKRKQEGRTAA